MMNWFLHQPEVILSFVSFTVINKEKMRPFFFQAIHKFLRVYPSKYFNVTRVIILYCYHYYNYKKSLMQSQRANRVKKTAMCRDLAEGFL